ncbi:MAG TPA: endonuclease/exonuclease/phosphatase family protein [Methylomirabilota bacterium]|jgi:endonuclease/exonuclease/phosphatase family metal-dependent hydrolase|nr:endonuclease/exonuclease/phosphatase family protein [Methylomirabilota bacterium]
MRPATRLVGAVLAGVLCLAAGREAMAEPARPLRYVSLNLLHGGVLSGLTGKDEDLEERLRIVVEELRALNPDVIGVQEASVSRRRGNVAKRLGGQLGFHYAHTTALFRIFAFDWTNHFIAWLMNFTEGPAILSRFPIVDVETHNLPRCNGWYDPRVLLYARLQTPWGELGVASTHATRGFCEASRVVELMLARRGPRPTVLMGDFNAGETSPGILALTNGAGFVDAFRTANPGVPGLTVWQRVTAPRPTVFRRVDYLFLLPGTEVPGRVVGSRVVLDAPRQLPGGRVLWPSDHYGVLAELEVLPPAAVSAREAPPDGS